jgi:hypothetical protein
MDQWASNTLRTVGIVFLAGLVIISSLMLLLLSMCAFSGGYGGGKDPTTGFMYLGACAGLVTLGIWGISAMARGIMHTNAELEAAGGPSTPASMPSTPAASIPLPISAAGHQAIRRLIYAIIAQMILSSAAFLYGQMHYWTDSRSARPQNWLIVFLASQILFRIPYLVLLYHLVKKPDRRTFAYALIVPCVLMLQSLFGISLLVFMFMRHPVGFILVTIPWLFHILVLAMAWKTVQVLEVRLQPSSLIVAAVVTFLYVTIIPTGTPIFYLLGWK